MSCHWSERASAARAHTRAARPSRVCSRFVPTLWRPSCSFKGLTRPARPFFLVFLGKTRLVSTMELRDTVVDHGISGVAVRFYGATDALNTKTFKMSDFEEVK